ncbi:hypothetical protein V8D89_013296 [Ganoderma adspersum]
MAERHGDTSSHAPAPRNNLRPSKRSKPYCQSTLAKGTVTTPALNGARIAGKRVGAACKACHAIHKQCMGDIPCQRCVSAGRPEQCIEHKRRKHHPASPGMRRLGTIASVAVSSTSAVQIAPHGTSDVVSSASVAATVSSLTMAAVSTAPMTTSSTPVVAPPTSDSNTQQDSYIVQSQDVEFIGQTFPHDG